MSRREEVFSTWLVRDVSFLSISLCCLCEEGSENCGGRGRGGARPKSKHCLFFSFFSLYINTTKTQQTQPPKSLFQHLLMCLCVSAYQHISHSHACCRHGANVQQATAKNKRGSFCLFAISNMLLFALLGSFQHREYTRNCSICA